MNFNGVNIVNGGKFGNGYNLNVNKNRFKKLKFKI